MGGIDVFDVPTQSAALNAAIGCVLSGRRTFLATSFVNEISDIVRIAQMNLPVVTVDISRAPGFFKPERTLSAFIDAGWLVYICESNQEIVDSLVRYYRICEDSKIMLPAVISIDHADFYEPVSMPSDQMIKNFLPKQLKKIDKKPNTYMAKPRNTKSALENVLKVYGKIDEAWKKKFKRTYDLSEAYMIEDAERIIITAGMHSATARATVSNARKNGEKIGLLRIASLNPFPNSAVLNLSGKSIAVVDSSETIYNEVSKRIKCSSYVLHSPTEKDFMNVFQSMKK